MLGFSAAVAPFRASTSRLVQGGATRSTRRMTEGGHTNLAAATDAGARSAVTAIAVILGLASGSTILTSPPTHDTGSSRCCKEDSTARSIGIVESNVQRLRFWVVDFIVLPSCRHRLTLLPSLNRVQCDDSSGRHYADAADQGYDDESGYTEAERFWGCIDYHRSLLHDYNRRWGPGIPVLEATDSSSSDGETITTRNDTVANLSAQWPRTIPTTTELSALECDLRYCERSPNYVNHIGICQDVKFRIASYYTTQNDEESQRLGFRTVKELAEQGHPDAMCYYGK